MALTRVEHIALNRRDKIYGEAQNTCNEAKRQAKELFEQAKKTAVDKQAKIQAELAYKEAIKQAEKARDAITDAAHVRFLAVSEQLHRMGNRTPMIDEAVRQRDQPIAQAFKACEAASMQAAQLEKETLKTAVDKQAKIQAELAYKEAIKQAEKARDAVVDEALEVFRVAWAQVGEVRGRT